jgi:hypothetical protein
MKPCRVILTAWLKEAAMKQVISTLHAVEWSSAGSGHQGGHAKYVSILFLLVVAAIQFGCSSGNSKSDPAMQSIQVVPVGSAMSPYIGAVHSHGYIR